MLAAASAPPRLTTPLLTRTGWLNKKERTPKPWGKASHSRRHFVSDGLGVTYYEKEGADQRGAINLRQVSALRPTSDATAPTEAVDLVVSGRTYTLEPQPSTRDERDAWLRLWVNAVPVAAVAPELSYLQVGLAARTVVGAPVPRVCCAASRRAQRSLALPLSWQAKEVAAAMQARPGKQESFSKTVALLALPYHPCPVHRVAVRRAPASCLLPCAGQLRGQAPLDLLEPRRPGAPWHPP
jgi:hypothetical protein